MAKLVIPSKEDVLSLVNTRAGETKLGERITLCQSGEWRAELRGSTSRFVLLGIPEDIGVRANYGIGGTQSLWPSALKAILNVQHTKLLKGEDTLVLGAFDFEDELKLAANADVDTLRQLTEQIDEVVFPIIQQIILAKKIPIVIGGGHNNCFPILKGASMAKDAAINCINLDAHSDFRAMEGRHSGNGFRYAHREGFLGKYEMIGLHENYNGQDIIEELTDDPDLHYSYYEDIFIREKLSFYEAIENAIERVQGKPTGIEIDMDCIERVLSSAATPAGISTIQARQYLNWCTQQLKPVYLHIAEGATELEDERKDNMTAKLAAYLVTDFIKAYPKK